jgi:hypothetical protein
MSRCADGISWPSAAKPRRRRPRLERLYVDLADGDLKLVKLVEAGRADCRGWTGYVRSTGLFGALAGDWRDGA